MNPDSFDVFRLRRRISRCDYRSCVERTNGVRRCIVLAVNSTLDVRLSSKLHASARPLLRQSSDNPVARRSLDAWN